MTAVLEAEYRIRCSDGEWRWILDRGVARRDDRGDLSHVCGFASDLTAAKVKEERLGRYQGSREVLHHYEGRKRDFLATLSQELRNPLAPIRNTLELLELSGPDDPRADAARNIIDNHLKQMAQLVEETPNGGRSVKATVTLLREQVDIASILDRAIEAACPRSDRDGHELMLDHPDPPIRLNADPVRLAQAFASLLSHVRKHMRQGGLIAIGIRRGASHVKVTIGDTGVGTAPRDLSGLFDAVTRPADASDRPDAGLALARGLIELHGGSIEVSERGAGIVVRIPLPMELTGVWGDSQADPRPPRRILVADDSDAILDALSLMLELRGYEVRVAHHGREAVEMAASFHPDVVLLDIGMPMMDGYEACRSIRAQRGGNGIRIFALTGWTEDSDGTSAGFDGHLLKPVETKALLRLLGEDVDAR